VLREIYPVVGIALVLEPEYSREIYGLFEEGLKNLT
jgi:hypothetical protein